MFDDKITKHESMGAISVNRVSGQTYLFGSEAQHQHFIRMEINEADMHRSLSEDRIFAGGRRLVEIDMTFEQWARFVSSFGIGMGTPCTLRRVGDRKFEDYPEPEHFVSKFQEDFKDTLKGATSKMEGLIAKLTESNLPGNKALGKKEQGVVLHDIQIALMQIKSNIPFLEDQFDEHMENKVAAAIIEVEGVVAHGLRETGLTYLRNAMPDYSRALSTNPTSLALPETPDDEIKKG